MSSPYAPADPAASRWIRALADGLQWARSESASPEVRSEWLELAVAVQLLGLPAGVVQRAREADAFEEIAAQVRVLHGQQHLLELHWWAAVHLARESVDAPADRRVAVAFSLMNIARELGWAHRVQDGLRDYGSAADPAHHALEVVIRRSTAWLGLDEHIRHGPVPGLAMSYPAAYRLAMELGELRAAHLLELDGYQRRLEQEVGPALALLDFHRLEAGAIERLAEPDGGLWPALDAWFAVGIGGLSDALYRAAHDHTVISTVPFRGLSFRRALGGLQRATRRLRGDRLAAELDALAVRVDAATEVIEDPPSGLTERVERWLALTVPADGLTELEHARVLAWAHRFRGHHVQVDAARIERFLAQFPGEIRWVGEGLLDAVEFHSRGQLAASIGFVLQSFGLAKLPGARLIESPLRAELHESGTRMPLTPLVEALGDGSATTLIYSDDALVTGARSLRRLQALLEALSEEERAALRERELVLVFAMGTLVGIDTVGTWLEEQGLHPRILVGRERRLLSDLGLEELDAGTLYDLETGWLTQPGAQLAAPLFSVHEPVWAGRDPAVARDICLEIGRAVDPQNPLGLGGLQGRLVFGHRVPQTTVACLRAGGEWRDRPWEPLFAPEAE